MCTPSNTPMPTKSGPRGHPAKSYATSTPEAYGSLVERGGCGFRERRLREHGLGRRRDGCERSRRDPLRRSRGSGRGAPPHTADDHARLALQEGHGRRDGEDVPEIVALEVATEEQECEQRERVSGEHRGQ